GRGGRGSLDGGLLNNTSVLPRKLSALPEGIPNQRLGVLKKRLGEHPFQVIGLDLGNLFEGLATEFTEREADLSLDANKRATRIDGLLIMESLVQAGDAAGQIRVMGHHGIEDLHRRPDVGGGGVPLFVIPAAVKPDSGGQVAALIGVEDLERVY